VVGPGPRCAARRARIQKIAPILHQGATRFEQVAAPVRSLNGAADRVRKGQLDDVVRVFCALAGPGRKGRAEAMYGADGVEAPQAHQHCSWPNGCLLASREQMLIKARERCQQRLCAAAEGHLVFAVRLHPRRRDDPNPVANFRPFGPTGFAGANGSEDRECKGVSADAVLFAQADHEAGDVSVGHGRMVRLAITLEVGQQVLEDLPSR